MKSFSLTASAKAWASLFRAKGKELALDPGRIPGGCLSMGWPGLHADIADVVVLKHNDLNAAVLLQRLC